MKIELTTSEYKVANIIQIHVKQVGSGQIWKKDVIRTESGSATLFLAYKTLFLAYKKLLVASAWTSIR
jgi:hypothetical protein